MVIFKYFIFVILMSVVNLASAGSLLAKTIVTFQVKDASVFNYWASERPTPFIQDGAATYRFDNHRLVCQLHKVQKSDWPYSGWKDSNFKNGNQIVIRIKSATNTEIMGETSNSDARLYCWKPGDIFKSESDWTLDDFRSAFGSSVIEVGN